jgi:hypothetical protein
MNKAGDEQEQEDIETSYSAIIYSSPDIYGFVCNPYEWIRF